MSLKYFIYKLENGLLLYPGGFDYDERLSSGFVSFEDALDFLGQNESSGEYTILPIVWRTK